MAGKRGQKLLTIKDVADRLSVSPNTVRALVKRGLLAPPRKVNGKLARWFPSDLASYLRSLREGKG